MRRNPATTLAFLERGAKDHPRVVLFPEANLTACYFPHLIELDPTDESHAVNTLCAAARQLDIWTIMAASARRTTAS